MTPLRIIQLAGYPLRIYASPLPVADHSWASFHELMTLAGMDEVNQPRWLDKLRHCGLAVMFSTAPIQTDYRTAKTKSPSKIMFRFGRAL